MIRCQPFDRIPASGIVDLQLREPENAPRSQAVQYAAREKRPIEKRLTRSAKFGRKRGGG
jgi:hypothetical protein